jgi:hypothetical protein
VIALPPMVKGFERPTLSSLPPPPPSTTTSTSTTTTTTPPLFNPNQVAQIEAVIHEAEQPESGPDVIERGGEEEAPVSLPPIPRLQNPPRRPKPTPVPSASLPTFMQGKGRTPPRTVPTSSPTTSS